MSPHSESPIVSGRDSTPERSSDPELISFRAGYDFELDPFQIEACEALENGDGVLVCAPTGAGKTVVGEFAVHLALQQGRKCFYTAPIKALSNQKYGDLAARHGRANVGLLTGDNAVNPDAPIVVMTTEVLRNMLYVGSPALIGLGYVVMDEVHYLADRFRGAVWEEVIIHLSPNVRLVSLSATVSNAEEFAAWLVTVRGHTRVVVSEDRPVPLWQHMFIGPRVYDLFATDRAAATLEVDPELVRAIHEQERRLVGPAVTGSRDRDRRGRRQRGRSSYPQRSGPAHRFRPLDRPSAIAQLDRGGLLPAIVFVFSRAGCDAAVTQCVRAGLRLTGKAERDAIRAIATRHTESIPDADLGVLGYFEWLDALGAGVAAHHAGLIPAFKETVEEAFAAGLVRAVFATETLALGINMPARSVVLERLIKYNGEGHVDLTPGDYTQLTGRAGRRGIDLEGHAVVAWSPGIDPTKVAGLASTRTFPLRSSFRPSYNMAVNLVGQLGRAESLRLLESSFAQFQADRAVVGLVTQIERNTEAMRGYAASMACDRGDVTGYAALRREVSDLEARLSRADRAARRAEAAASLERLRRGDVILVPEGRRSGMGVVVEMGRGSGGHRGSAALGGLPTVLTVDRRLHTLTPVDVNGPVEHLGAMRIPTTFDLHSPRSRRDLASSLRNLALGDSRRAADRRSAALEDADLARLRRALRDHPCHHCPDREEHARWAQRHRKLARENDGLRQRVEARRHTVARTFARVIRVLQQLGYLGAELDGDPADTGPRVTDRGRRLGRIWAEADLLVAECVHAGIWRDLPPAELAAVVSCTVFEPRRTDPPAAHVPAAIDGVLVETRRIWDALTDAEHAAGIEATRRLDAGFSWPILRWARGESLGVALAAADSSAAGGSMGEEGMPAGDFVRWCKQVTDLLDQIAAVAPKRLASTARAAVAAINRGVVAAATAS
ncbi:MAG: DEAD/DEAH box helicase [Mycobacteriales bacterium]